MFPLEDNSVCELSAGWRELVRGLVVGLVGWNVGSLRLAGALVVGSLRVEWSLRLVNLGVGGIVGSLVVI